MIKKTILKLLSIIVTTSVLLGISYNDSIKSVQAKEKEEMVTGDLKPTEEEEKWFDENSTKVEDVKYNTLAESRINSKRKARIARMPQGVEIGEEIVEKGESKEEMSTVDNNILLDSVDNSELACFPKIGNQKSLGSCASFATTYYQMTHMVGLKNGWDNKNSNLNTKFSPKWTYNMCNYGENKGSSSIVNIRVLSQIGAATWTEFPYVGDRSNPKNYREWSTDSKVWKNAQKYKVDEFGYIPVSSSYTDTPITNPKDSDLTLIKKYLINGYVLNFSTYFSGYSMTNVKDNPNTKNDDSYVGEDIIKAVGNDGRHSMIIVGYNDDIWVDINNNGNVDNGELGAFKVANSWGEDYCNNGFVWFAYDSLNKVSSVNGASSNSNRQECFENYNVRYFNVKDIKQPKLAVEFTANHALRNQIAVEISAKDTSNNKEISYKQFRDALHYSGGPYAFDGSNTAVDGKFSLDFDKIISLPEFNEKTFDKWFIKFKDCRKDGKPLEIKDIKLIDDNGNVYALPNEGESKSIDGNEFVFSFDYKIGGLKKPTLEFEESSSGLVMITYDATQPVVTNGYYYLYENGKCVKCNKGVQPILGKSTYASVLQPGEYEYKVVAEDFNGNKVESDILRIKIEELRQPILSVKENGNLYDGEFSLHLKLNQIGEKNIYYTIYENGVCVKSNYGKDYLKRDRDFDMFTSKDGLNKYKVEIIDDKGNKAVSNEVEVLTAKGAKEWKVGTYYKLKDKVVYKGSVYECTYNNKAQYGWEPSIYTSALWKKLY